eukprot:RCo029083
MLGVQRSLVAGSAVGDLWSRRRVDENAPEKPLLTVSVVQSFGIVWLNGQYWQRVSTSESPRYGEIAKLHSVCWLELNSHPLTLPGPGLYYVSFRMKLEHLNFHADWTVSQDGHELLRLQTDVQYGPLRAIVGQGWRYFTVGSIRARDTAPISVRIFGNNPGWCGGISFDELTFSDAWLPWEAAKPVWEGLYCSNSSLYKLVPDILRIILGFLAPVPVE